VRFSLDLEGVLLVRWEKRETVLAKDWQNKGAWQVACRSRRRVTYRGGGGGKRQIGRHRRMRGDNIKIDNQ
jgi:hypothetical protein